MCFKPVDEFEAEQFGGVLETVEDQLSDASIDISLSSTVFFVFFLLGRLPLVVLHSREVLFFG